MLPLPDQVRFLRGVDRNGRPLRLSRFDGRAVSLTEPHYLALNLAMTYIRGFEKYWIRIKVHSRILDAFAG